MNAFALHRLLWYGARMEHALDLSEVPGTPVLVGVGGSRAYGLATVDSDVDYRGCYVAPTREFFRFVTPRETYDRQDPDVSMHEVGKFLRLAIAGNPSILESLFFSEYVIKTTVGESILKHRDLFVTNRIRATHLGYADQQLKRISKRDSAVSVHEDDKRSSKNARHLLRLIKQVERAMTTGEFRITVEDRDEIFAFGGLPRSDMLRKAEREIERVTRLESVLPSAPNIEKIEAMLIRIRVQHMSAPMLSARGTNLSG